MRTETVTRVRDDLEIQTLCPAEPLTVNQPAQVLNGWRLYLPETTDVTARDRLRVRGIEYSVINEPATWAAGGQVVDVADIWTAVCTIRHPGGTRGEFNKTTGTYPAEPNAPHYTGECQVRVLSPAEQQQLFAEQLVTEVGYVVVVDLDTSAAVKVGDVVTITAFDASGDAALIDQPLQVQSFARGEFPWQRDLRCTLQLPTD